MKDKEKQIEEMAEVLCESKEHNCNGEDCKCLKQATDLFDRGARIFPEDSVVLSREEKQRLKSIEIAFEEFTKLDGILIPTEEYERLNRVEAELQELNAKYYNEAKDLRRELKQFKAFMKRNDWESIDDIETTLDKCQEVLYEKLQQTSKETAETLLSELYYIARFYYGDSANVLAWAKDKAKSLGVEIKE